MLAERAPLNLSPRTNRADFTFGPSLSSINHLEKARSKLALGKRDQSHKREASPARAPIRNTLSKSLPKVRYQKTPDHHWLASRLVRRGSGYQSPKPDFRPGLSKLMSRPPNDAEIQTVQKDPPELPKGVSREPWTAWKDARLTRNTLLRLDDHVDFADTHSGVRTAILRIIGILLEEAQSRFCGKEKKAPNKEITSSAEEGWLTANLTHENVEKSEGVIDALFHACPADTPVHEMSSSKYGALGLEVKPSKTKEELIDGVKVYEQYVPLGEARAVDLQVRDRCHASAKNKAERILFLAVVGPFVRPYYWIADHQKTPEGVIFEQPCQETGKWPGTIRPTDSELVHSGSRLYSGPDSKLWLDLRDKRGKLVLQQVIYDLVRLADDKEPEFVELYGRMGRGHSQKQVAPSTSEGSSSSGSDSDPDHPEPMEHRDALTSPAKVRSKTAVGNTEPQEQQ